MTTLTNDDLYTIEARANAATPGPWSADSTKSEGSYGSGDDVHEGYDAYEIIAEVRGKTVTLADSLNATEGEIQEDFDGDETGSWHSAWDEIARRNFDFIAHAREDVPALVAEVRSLTGQRNDLLEALTVIANASERSESMFGGKMSEVTRVFEHITRVSRAAIAKATGAA